MSAMEVVDFIVSILVLSFSDVNDLYPKLSKSLSYYAVS